jgi:hypothetical protein
MAIYLVNLDGYESAQEASDPSEAIRLARCESGKTEVVCPTCKEYASLDDIPVKKVAEPSKEPSQSQAENEALSD